jgi:ABC-2 type transport system permease protein
MLALRHFALLLGQQLQAKLEYRGDFLLQLLVYLLQQLTWLAFIWTLFRFVPTVQGWTFWEAAFLYGLAIVPAGLNQLFFEGAFRLPALIGNGGLDRLLIRPLDPVVHVFSLSVGLHGVGTALLGVVILAQAASHLPVAWNPLSVAYLLLAIAGGTIISASINLATTSLSFWTDDTGASVPFMANRLVDFGRFPLSLYPSLLSGALTWLLPAAFIGFVPASFLLGRAPWWFGFGTPLAAALSFLVARAIFLRGLRRYESTGH